MGQFTTLPGYPLPLGSSASGRGINIAVFSRHACRVNILLFDNSDNSMVAEIPLDPTLNRTGDIWHILLEGEGIKKLSYAYRVSGPAGPPSPVHRFNAQTLLLDPYAKSISGGCQWGREEFSAAEDGQMTLKRRCNILEETFDWEGDRPLKTPLRDTVIYEMHVRGFTRDPSSQVSAPGTFSGVVEKIPYLKDLGITAVELMPITEFNENENLNHNPQTGEKLKNFWGYSPISFFAPKASYAADPENPVREFKELVKALHRAGIEIILDVVFNHTAEGGADGPTFSFRGLDNSIYYILDPHTGDYLNYSGCGNTLNCNHPVVRELILNCLRYWVLEMHVDGFRFDLASILGRDQKGKILSNPPIVEKIAEDPVLSQTKIIAEAWDASGLYQVGSFSSNQRWAEWNGRFRDDVRAFMCGHENSVPALATRIAGSADLYQRSDLNPLNSINFITSHDGFTLFDLVSFNKKRNIANGENNKDGSDHNISWNSGIEGLTDDAAVNSLRFRRIRTMATILFISQGVPMILAGDELGRTQYGNNNAYCQDNSISWLNWELADRNRELLLFFRHLIRLRKNHSVFRRCDFFQHPDSIDNGIIWQSTSTGAQDWSPSCHTLAFMLDGTFNNKRHDDDFFIMLNGDRVQDETFEAPAPPPKRQWHLIIDTADPAGKHFLPEDQSPPLRDIKYKVAAMGAVVLISKPANQ
jgi:glycogen operon protein